MILYGLVTETSIPKLFLAGIVPGVMLTVLIFVICYAISLIRDLPTSPVEPANRICPAELFDRKDAILIVAATSILIVGWVSGLLTWWGALLASAVIALIHLTMLSKRFSFRKVLTDLYRAIPALLMPVLVVVLARGGTVMPTEISVLAVVYTLLVGAFI